MTGDRRPISGPGRPDSIELVADSEAAEIIDQISDAAAHLVESNVALLNRLAEGSSSDAAVDRRGALQDVWMTWAEGAGDLVTISYLTAQFFDALAGTDGPDRWPRREHGVTSTNSELSGIANDAKDVYVKFWSNLHEAAFRVTDGRILNRVLGMPVIRLTTTGRRTGDPRAVMLTAPIVEGHRIVVVASNGGDLRHPQWFLNLVANPEVVVTSNGRTTSMRARVADADERDRLWTEIRRVTPGYTIYQRMTSREIPVVVLEPKSSTE